MSRRESPATIAIEPAVPNPKLMPCEFTAVAKATVRKPKVIITPDGEATNLTALKEVFSIGTPFYTQKSLGHGSLFESVCAAAIYNLPVLPEATVRMAYAIV